MRTLLINLPLVLLLLFALAGVATARGPRLGAQAGEVATLDVEDLRTRAASLAESCIAHVTKLGELRTKPADKRGDTYVEDVRAAADNLALDDQMHQAVSRILREHDDAERAKADAQARQRGGGRGPSAATGDTTEPDRRSAGQQVVEHEAFADYAAGRTRSVDIEVRALLTTASDDGPSAGLFIPRGTPFLNEAAISRRRLFVRDVLSGGSTTLSSVPYIQEKAPRTSEEGAQMVAEGAAKPEVTLEFQPADAPVRKIAAWIQATTEALADAQTLRAYVDARLAYMLMVREEVQLLNGTGVAPNLRGIRQTVGLQTVAGPAGDNLTAIAQGIEKIELVDGDADGLAINPTDFWGILTRRATGDNHYDVDPFMDPARMAPWGLPPIRTRALPAGKAIVGAWRIGGQVLDREGTVIRVGDQHSDFFTSNKVAVLAESRLAFLNHRPDYFVEVTFNAAA